jgi:hypothetical protein
MGYAIKQGTAEFRAVQDKTWCLDGEVFSDSPPQIPVAISDVEIQRLIAYADPVTGSDRYLSEAASLVAAGISWGDDEVRTLQAKAVEVKAEIQKKYPYPGASAQ